MSFDELPEFKKEFKKLGKKFRSLSEDLMVFRKVVSKEPLGTGKRHFNVVHHGENVRVVKARLFCRYLKGTDKMRIIYAYHADEQKVTFLELYFKGEKVNENRERIKEFIKN